MRRLVKNRGCSSPDYLSQAEKTDSISPPSSTGMSSPRSRGGNSSPTLSDVSITVSKYDLPSSTLTMLSLLVLSLISFFATGKNKRRTSCTNPRKTPAVEEMYGIRLPTIALHYNER